MTASTEPSTDPPLGRVRHTSRRWPAGAVAARLAPTDTTPEEFLGSLSPWGWVGDVTGTRSTARRRRRETLSVVRDDRTTGNNAEPAIDARRALANLSPQQRAAVYLSYWEDQTAADIAELLGVSEGSVRKQLGARATPQGVAKGGSIMNDNRPPRRPDQPADALDRQIRDLFDVVVAATPAAPELAAPAGAWTTTDPIFTTSALERRRFYNISTGTTPTPASLGLEGNYGGCSDCPDSFTIDRPGEHVAWIEGAAAETRIVIVELATGARVEVPVDPSTFQTNAGNLQLTEVDVAAIAAGQYGGYATFSSFNSDQPFWVDLATGGGTSQNELPRYDLNDIDTGDGITTLS